MGALKKNVEIKFIVAAILVLFAAFLAVPMAIMAIQSFHGENGFTLEFYSQIFSANGFGTSVANSLMISMGSAVVTTALAFVLAYTVNYTTVCRAAKRFIRIIALVPMFLPTITYGFAIIYAFGRQGLITRLLGGRQLFDIYGFSGLMIGYIIYTLPISFVLINNTMGYIDKKFLVVSRVLGDNAPRSFMTAVVRPLSGSLTASVMQCFALSFTDYGIPNAVGGRTHVIATVLYDQMLGALPDFNTGSVVAVVMLLPSVASILLLAFIERYNIRYKNITEIEIRKDRVRDVSWGAASALISLLVIGIFATVFVVPVVVSWPYRLDLTLDHFRKVFADSELSGIYWNSLFVAVITAAVGTLVVYGSALATARSRISAVCRQSIDSISLITNTIPGMVLGIAYLLTFTGTNLQNTFVLIIICNIIHFYSTPYLMMKSSLEKLDETWENTAKLMGDSWFRTLIRVVTPNTVSTLAEVFSYYFINAMVTISAVIFIVGPGTMVLTTKIKELEHYMQFDDIFVLSLLILFTNLAVKCMVEIITRRKERRK
jgi:iron(III) transport system permease protein